MDPSERDWDALLYLVGTGMNECPWGWDDEYARNFPGWERPDFEAAISRCSDYLKTRAA